MLYKAVVDFLVFWCRLSRCKVEGFENLPKTGAVVTMANHVHVFDPFLLAEPWWRIKRPVRFMSKAEFFDKRVLGKIFRAVGAFPVNRGEADLASLKTALGILKEEQVLGIFPEGTRNKNSEGALLEFKQGATMIAYKAKAVIVPVAIINAGNLFKFWRTRPRVIIGEPISFADEKRSSKEVMGVYTEMIKDDIAGMLAQGKNNV